jgi:hypothetical protein
VIREKESKLAADQAPVSLVWWDMSSDLKLFTQMNTVQLKANSQVHWTNWRKWYTGLETSQQLHIKFTINNSCYERTKSVNDLDTYGIYPQHNLQICYKLSFIFRTNFQEHLKFVTIILYCIRFKIQTYEETLLWTNDLIILKNNHNSALYAILRSWILHSHEPYVMSHST